jgi:hypothetical protein
MLEHPKALCTFGTYYDKLNKNTERENHKDGTMGNQQERFNLELAWLAGIIEGEGWVSLAIISSLKKNKVKYPAFHPSIGVTNTDLLMIEKIEAIFKALELKYRKQIRLSKIYSDGILRKTRIELSVFSRQYITKLANSILPYMYGEKKKRMQKLFEFYKIRDTKPKRGINSKYGAEEFALYEELYSYKGKRTSRLKILNDYTLNAVKGDDIV